jgi:hypothetical protein
VDSDISVLERLPAERDQIAGWFGAESGRDCPDFRGGAGTTDDTVTLKTRVTDTGAAGGCPAR